MFEISLLTFWAVKHFDPHTLPKYGTRCLRFTFRLSELWNSLIPTLLQNTVGGVWDFQPDFLSCEVLWSLHSSKILQEVDFWQYHWLFQDSIYEWILGSESTEPVVSQLVSVVSPPVTITLVNCCSLKSGLLYSLWGGGKDWGEWVLREVGGIASN